MRVGGGECDRCRARRLAHGSAEAGPADPASYGLTEMALLLRDRSAGAALDGPARERVEAKAGRPLGDVRVHDGAPARAAADLLGVRAFTLGRDIYLGGDAAHAGESVIDHEAAHTLQQRPWAGEPLTLDGLAGRHERDAERVAAGDGHAAALAEGPATPMGIAWAAWMAILGELACLFGFFFYALKNLAHKGDKYLHCWTSCKIATYCAIPLVAQGIALLIGALKELADVVIGEAELRDMANNVSGVECSLHYLTSCDDCCEGKLKAGKLAENESGGEDADTQATAAAETAEPAPNDTREAPV